MFDGFKESAREWPYLERLATGGRQRSQENPDPEEMPGEGVLDDDPTDPHKYYRTTLRALCDALARSIAKDPEFLSQVEWRDLERTLGGVFEGLGFDVEVTRPGKDGGKDIILEWSIDGQPMRWYVEVKHWVDKAVGKAIMKHFLQITVRDGVKQGLLLSTGGFVPGAYQALSVVERRRLSLGAKVRWTPSVGQNFGRP